jgi:protein KRI1
MTTIEERSAKKSRLLDDEESSETLEETKLNINEEYARRFEHNKKRAELHRCMSAQ